MNGIINTLSPFYKVLAFKNGISDTVLLKPGKLTVAGMKKKGECHE